MSYSTGTVNFTKGSTAVVGIGTEFDGNVFSGQSIVGADGRTYAITSIETDTGLTLESAYTGKTAYSASYLISSATNSDYDENAAVNAAFAPTYDFESTNETVSDGAALATTSLTTNDDDGRKEDVAATRFFGDGTAGYSGWAVRTSNGSESLRDRLRVRSSGDVEFLNSDGSTVGVKWSAADEEFQIDVPITGDAVQSDVDDATDGKLLTVGAGGLLNRAIPVTDLDAITTTGLYSIESGSALAGGAPIASAFVVEHIGYNNLGHGAQMAYRIAPNGGEVFTRAKFAGSQLTWYQVVTQKTMVGTVSQSGGLATGAAFEKPVSNANGYYHKKADGTMECWHTLTADSGAGETWTFPSTDFIEAPVVTMTAISTVSASAQLDAAPTATTATFSVWDKADARRADVVHLRATGRWSDLT